MIINLNLQNKKVCVVGGGNESLKRITTLLKENCRVTVLSNVTNKQINDLFEKRKILVKKQKIKNANFLTKEKPFMVIASTNDQKLNSEIIEKAKKLKIISYSSDNPEQSDFSNPATLNFENAVEIAIFTGGKSPIMSRKIKEKLKKTLKKAISKEDIDQIKIQNIARSIVKKEIDNQIERKYFLTLLIRDKKIKRLIKVGKSKDIEKYIISKLRDWK